MRQIQLPNALCRATLFIVFALFCLSATSQDWIDLSKASVLCSRMHIFKLKQVLPDGYVYYYCRKHRVDKKCPCTISLREDRIERALTASLFQPGQIVVDSVKAAQNAEKHVQTASEIERKMKRLAETYTDGLIDREAYKSKLATLTEQLEAVRMAPSRPSEPVSERVREFLHGDIIHIIHAIHLAFDDVLANLMHDT